MYNEPARPWGSHAPVILRRPVCGGRHYAVRNFRARQQKHGSARLSAATLTALPTTSWPTNGGNSQRYSPLKAIDRSNVARLKGVWHASARFRAQRLCGTAPIVADGVAYISTGANDVFALSIDSGDILWR